MEQDNNYVNAFSRPLPKERTGFLAFFYDFFSYIVLRFTQFFRVLGALCVVLTSGGANIKGWVIRRMYWGRTSFYKAAFQIAVVVITVGALFASINSRTALFGKKEQGIVAATGIVGNNDLLYQVGTVDAITEAPVTNVDYEILKYTVKRGDSLSSIAREFGISQDTIRWANGIPKGKDTLRTGQVINIPPMNGVYYTVAAGDTVDKVIKKVKGANSYDLIELNNLVPPNYSLRVGQQLFIPDATYTPPVAVQKKYYSGTKYVSTPSVAVNVRAGTFVNPLLYCGGYHFIRGYYSGHTGLDLGGPSGCWINAVGSGVVKKAGACGGGMGNCVVIIHDNGYSTVYMHGNGIFAVHTGQRVAAGQKIMQMGRSGNASGVHLHLSIAPPGVDVVNSYYGRINPRGLIPY